MDAAPIVEVRNITKSFGTKRALDGISMNVDAGRIHVLLGRNGSGKTTLAKVLAGILRPDSGTIRANGIADPESSPQFRANVGFLFDSSAHWDSLTGHENAWFFARSFGLRSEQAEERITTLFDQLSLTEVAGDLVSTYSFGMKRKLALVQALAHNPSLLVLDEPSIGLDHASRISIYTILRARASKGLSMVIATNDMNEARYMADIVSLMDRGKILVTGSPTELISSLGQGVLVQVELKVPVAEDSVMALPGVEGASLRQAKDTYILEVLAALNEEHLVTSELLRFLSERGIGFSKLGFRGPELGDVFLKYLRGAR